MFGFLFGSACLLGLAAVARRHHHGGHHHHHGFRGGFRRRGLRYAFERLDTSPAQEKAILEALDSLRERLGSAKDDVRGKRKDVAEAFRGETIDVPTFGALFDGPLELLAELLAELRDEVAATAARIHDVLTPKQRERLADLIEMGPHFGLRRGGAL